MKGLKSDILINVLSAFLKGVILLLTIRFAGLIMGSMMMGVYLLARRIAITGSNLLVMGMAPTLLRYLSIYEDDPGAQKIRYLFALFGASLITVIIFALYFSGASFFANLFFPALPRGEELLFWLVILLVAILFHYVVYSSLFAFRRIVLANLVELINSGGILLIVLLWSGKGADALMILHRQALATLIFTGVVVVAIFFYLHRRGKAHWEDFSFVREEFIEFGLPRGFIAFLDSGTLLVGPWLLRDHPRAAGYLIVALIVVRFLQMAITPITQVLSVVTARLTGKGEEEKIRLSVRLMFGILIYSTFFVTVLFVPWLEKLLVVWLKKPEIVEGTKLFASYLIWSIAPVTIFYGMRGIIEMRWKSPKNLYNLLLSQSAQILFFFLFRSSLGVEYATGLSFFVLFFLMGGLSLYFLRHDLGDFSFWRFDYLFVFLFIFYGINIFIAHHFSVIYFIPTAIFFTLLAMILAYKLRGYIPFWQTLINFLLPQRFIQS